MTILLTISGFLLLYWAGVEVKKNQTKWVNNIVEPIEESHSIIYNAVKKEIDMNLKQSHVGWYLNKPRTQNLLSNEFVGKANAKYLSNSAMEKAFVNTSRKAYVADYLTQLWMIDSKRK